MEAPLVSILMTAYNRQQYIAEAIESVLASSYRNIELIIVDDGSKDDTVAIARAYEQKDSRIHVYINERNLGDYSNRNRAASYAKGEYIMYVDSDDMLFADGVQRCVDVMLRFSHASIGMRIYEVSGESFELASAEVIDRHFFKKPLLGTGPGGTIIRRSFFNSINQYPAKYGPANDMYFNLKAVCHSSIVMIPFEFLYYRRHEGQEINNRYSYLINNYNYLKDALNELPLKLSAKQLEWLHAKNKRRFVVNTVKYFFATFQADKVRAAIRLTNFSWQDLKIALFN